MVTELVDRNRALINYHEEHLEVSYRDLAKLFHISRQRAHKLMQQQRERKSRPDPPPPRLFEKLTHADVLRDRNIMLLECHKAHPEVSYAELGKHFHLSKHAVYQLIRWQRLNMQALSAETRVPCDAEPQRLNYHKVPSLVGSTSCNRA